MNEELHNVLHAGVTDRLDKLEDSVAHLIAPEEGTLAQMRRGITEDISRLEAKLNYLFILILTSVGGALWVMVSDKLGLSG